MLTNWHHLNLLAILAGGFLYIIYGTIYYSIFLSDRKKSRPEGLFEQMKGPSKYIFSIVIAFISSFLVSFLIQASDSHTGLEGALTGFIIGFLISMVYFKNCLFGLMSKKAFWIAIGDHLVVFTLLGFLQGFIL
ncbi:DUF1761 domain-containing protein [Metabacillus sp. RGM 3146]|uniref:DUF1761 domain-containing protein n=1 Tax=Metabacillus sp. RGM 3146 TaxID=3401092 RepID=UPI003B9D1C3A